MDQVTTFVQRFGVPIAMTGVYAVLAWSADTSTTGKAWMADSTSWLMGFSTRAWTPASASVSAIDSW